MDVTIFHIGATPATLSDSLYAPAGGPLSIGGRYRFSIHGAAATLRMQVQNVTNQGLWFTGFNPGYYLMAPRGYLAYLTVDV
jgi:iron complex outermembrane recepter protein